MIWSYIRNRTREAFLAGLSDGLAEAEGNGTEGLAEAAALFRARLQALPAPGNGTQRPQERTEQPAPADGQGHAARKRQRGQESP